MADNEEYSQQQNGQNGHSNGNEKKDSESQQQPARSRFAAALQTFSPIWFAAVMNTGILGIIMHQNPQPYNGDWWQIVSYILYVISLVLFFGFMLVMLLRAVLYPKSIPTPSPKHSMLSVEATALGACMPIAAFTLIGQTTLIASDSNWNGTGHGFAVFCYVAWWVVVVWILATAATLLVNLTLKDGMSPDALPPAAIIPGVGVVTAALVGAVVVTYGFDVSPQLAVPVIIVGYMLVGFGVFWAVFVYSMMLVKMLNDGFPEAEKIPTLAFLVGPPGQAAGALVALGQAATMHFPRYAGTTSSSVIFTTIGGEIFSATSILLAFMFLGLYTLWLIFALFSMLRAFWNGEIKGFAFTWWGTIFPTATGNLAFVLLATAINSQAFAVLSCIWLVVLFIDYFVCLGFTIVGVARGQILDGRSEEEKDRRRKRD